MLLLYAHEASLRYVYVFDGDMFKHQCNRAIVDLENGISNVYVFQVKVLRAGVRFVVELKLHWSSGYEKSVCRAVQLFFVFRRKSID